MSAKNPDERERRSRHRVAKDFEPRTVTTHRPAPEAVASGKPFRGGRPGTVAVVGGAGVREVASTDPGPARIGLTSSIVVFPIRSRCGSNSYATSLDRPSLVVAKLTSRVTLK